MKAKRTGMFIYCTQAEKARITAAAKKARRTLSQYVLIAALKAVKR